MSRKLNSKQIAGTLRRCVQLGELDAQELTTLAQMVEVRAFDPGEAVYEPDDDGGSMFVVSSGKVEFYVPLDERRRVIGLIGPVNSFGELGLLLPGARMLGARAIDEVTAFELTAGSLKMLETSDPSLALKIIAALRARGVEVLAELRPLITSLFVETLKRAQKGSASD